MTPKLAYELFFRTNPDHITDAMFIKAHQIIEDLVAKATPMKPIGNFKYESSIPVATSKPKCPMCFTELHEKYNRCPNADCDQKFDWSDEK